MERSQVVDDYGRLDGEYALTTEGDGGLAGARLRTEEHGTDLGRKIPDGPAYIEDLGTEQECSEGDMIP